MKTSSEVKFGIQRAMEMINKVRKNPEICDQIIENPVHVLESFGISVEDQFQDAVASNLKSMFQDIKEKGVHVAIPQKVKFEDIDPPAAPTGLHVTEKSKSEDIVLAQADLAAVKKGEKLPPRSFYCNIWGTVLRLNEEGMRDWRVGKGIEIAVASAIAAVLGPVTEGIGALVAGLYAAALSGQLAVAEGIDEGKGVYLTTLWGQFVLPLGTSFPIITPIK